MEFITSTAVLRHLCKEAGCVRHPHRLKEVTVDQCYSTEFDIGGPGVYTVRVDDEWVVTYCDDSGILTVTRDGVRSVFYIHYLPDRHMVSGWAYRNQTPR